MNCCLPLQGMPPGARAGAQILLLRGWHDAQAPGEQSKRDQRQLKENFV